jgi:inosine-uridine nucleoside N-ribohydrolase
MVPLDVTESHHLEEHHIEHVKRIPHKWISWVGSLLEKLRAATLSYGDPHPTLHDAIAVSYVVSPHLFKSQEVHLRVTTDGERYGQTETVPGQEPNLLLLTEVDGAAFWKQFFRSLQQSAHYTT